MVLLLLEMLIPEIKMDASPVTFNAKAGLLTRQNSATAGFQINTEK